MSTALASLELGNPSSKQGSVRQAATLARRIVICSVLPPIVAELEKKIADLEAKIVELEKRTLMPPTKEP